MSLDALKSQFFTAIFPHRPNEWEVEEYLTGLAELDAERQREVFRQVAVIWPVSQSLCYNFLTLVSSGLSCLHPSQLPGWVKATLDIYEEQGLRQATAFMADVENNFLCRIRGETGLRFEEAAGRLRPYVRGISGRDLHIAAGPETYTDTLSIYLPREINIFPSPADAFLLYKLTVTLQWGLIARGTFADRRLAATGAARQLLRTGPGADDHAMALADVLARFPDRDLGLDLFHLFATVRAFAWLKNRFPGLMRDCRSLLARLARMGAEKDPGAGIGAVIEALRQDLLADGMKAEGRHGVAAAPYLAEARAIAARVAQQQEGPLAAAAELYLLLRDIAGGYQSAEPLPFAGVLKPAAVAAARARRREENRHGFIKALAAILPSSGEGEKPQPTEQAAGKTASVEQDAAALIIPGAHSQGLEKPDQQPQSFVRVAEQNVALPAAMQPLLDEIIQDLGHIPAQYVSAAMQMAGRAASGFAAPPAEAGEELALGPLIYDEWDFRREGFRKNWCSLLKKELTPVTSTFLAATLEKYHGTLIKLKKEFEMLRKTTS